MLFASERELNVFYLLTARSTLKVEELQANPSATLSVLSKADEISDYTETTVIGTVTLHDEFPSAPVQTGLGLLAKKSTMIQAVLDNGSLGDYVVLVLRPAEIVFRKYRDVLANAPKTILRF
jgi:hypothetical protein